MIKTELHHSLEQLLLEHCLPPCVIVNKNGEVLYIHGSIGHLFEPTAGLPSLNIVDMARSGLGTKLSYAIREVGPENTELSYRNVVISDLYHCRFNLTIRWIENDYSPQGIILMSFEEINNENSVSDDEVLPRLQDDPRIIELERELKFTKENLQSTIEELKSTNEELQSTNEGLQSTNEELETSKEELVTVNSELESRIDELTNINDDIKNLLDSTHIATIFLDQQLLIKRYTPKAVDIVRFIQTDIGRPIFDIVHNLKCDNFFDLIQNACEVGESIEQEVKSSKDLTYLMRITPYFTAHGEQDGVVLTFEDISELKLHR